MLPRSLPSQAEIRPTLPVEADASSKSYVQGELETDHALAAWSAKWLGSVCTTRVIVGGPPA